jgi:uncharacterized protein YaaW (UPF0174 family)
MQVSTFAMKETTLKINQQMHSKFLHLSLNKTKTKIKSIKVCSFAIEQTIKIFTSTIPQTIQNKSKALHSNFCIYHRANLFEIFLKMNSRLYI